MTKKDTNGKKKEQYVTLSRVVSEFGIPRNLVDKLLPPPILKDNPHYKCAAPMKLYRLKDVKRIVAKSKTLKKALEKSRPFRERAKKAVETKMASMRKRMEEAIERIRVNTNVKDVEQSAVRHYNQHKLEVAFMRNDFDFEAVCLKTCDNRAFIERITVNFIRHCLTQYDSRLYRERGKVGIGEFYDGYKKAVLMKIAEAFPQYKAECERQANADDMVC